MVLHHIVGDRWSAGILAEEMEALYAAFSLGEPSPLREPSVQYADFSIWQRNWLQGSELDRQAAYWKRQLAGSPALLEFPTDHPRPALLGHKGATQTVDVYKRQPPNTHERATARPSPLPRTSLPIPSQNH